MQRLFEEKPMDKELLELLLEAAYSIDFKDFSSRHTFEIVAEKGDMELLKLVLDRSKRPSKEAAENYCKMTASFSKEAFERLFGRVDKSIASEVLDNCFLAHC